jgi:hypothetical protein
MNNKSSKIFQEETVHTVEDQIVPVRRASENAQQFKEDIALWVLLDSRLATINENARKMRKTKHETSDRICRFLIDNNIKNKIKIKCEEQMAEIKMYDKKDYSALTFGYIESCLSKIIHDEEQVNYVMDFLRENREITSSPDIMIKRANKALI